MPQTAWLDREFAFNLPIGLFPAVLERLRGTPLRAKDFVAGISENILATRLHGKWSAKEHPAHLADLEQLDHRRVTEFLNHVEVLSAADIENRVTERVNHRCNPAAEIVRRLTAGRDALVVRLEALTEKEVGIVAVHPRLQKPMRLLDWMYFVAEHDDHHLAQARRVIAALQT